MHWSTEWASTMTVPKIVAQRLMTQNENNLRPPFPARNQHREKRHNPATASRRRLRISRNHIGPHADYLAINISSPNTPGLRDLQSQTQVTRIIQAVQSAAPGKPVFVKLAPELTGALAGRSSRRLSPNPAQQESSRPTRWLLSAKTACPTAGSAANPCAKFRCARWRPVRKHVGTQLAIIGCGGIDDSDSARAMFDAGAGSDATLHGLRLQGPLSACQLRGS